MNLEKTLALGTYAQLPHDEQLQVDECVKNLKAVISQLPKSTALVAYMMFSVAILEESRK